MTVATTPGSDPQVGQNIAERRRSSRERRDTHAWLSAATCSKNSNGVSVKIRDLSLHGVGMVTEHHLKKHDTHWLIVADHSLRLSTRVRIISVRKNEQGTYEVGGEFF